MDIVCGQRSAVSGYGSGDYGNETLDSIHKLPERARQKCSMQIRSLLPHSHNVFTVLCFFLQKSSNHNQNWARMVILYITF